jgi:CRISPR-associated protein Cas6/Cse3/CasE subtype I-E
VNATLSRALIELHATPGVRGATTEYRLHQAVASLFRDHGGRPYLFRDLRSQGGRHQVLILSRVPPKIDSPARTLGGASLALESKSYRPKLDVGSVVGFDLLVNATTVLRGPEPADTPKLRRDVWDAQFRVDRGKGRWRVDPYADYLARRLGTAAGIRDVALVERQAWRVRRHLGEAPMRFIATRLVGRLTVTDPDLLLDLIVSGIGRAKAFGCGLLCLIPANHLPLRRRGE